MITISNFWRVPVKNVCTTRRLFLACKTNLLYLINTLKFCGGLPIFTKIIAWKGKQADKLPPLFFTVRPLWVWKNNIIIKMPIHKLEKKKKKRSLKIIAHSNWRQLKHCTEWKIKFCVINSKFSACQIWDGMRKSK